MQELAITGWSRRRARSSATTHAVGSCLLLLISPCGWIGYSGVSIPNRCGGVTAGVCRLIHLARTARVGRLIHLARAATVHILSGHAIRIIHASRIIHHTILIVCAYTISVLWRIATDIVGHIHTIVAARLSESSSATCCNEQSCTNKAEIFELSFHNLTLKTDLI